MEQTRPRPRPRPRPAPAAAAPVVAGFPSAGVDRLKGLLLLAVVYGHTYSQGVGQSLSKSVIYGFHMPAFLFLSGYVIVFDRQRRRTPIGFVGHYARRMLWQWALVSVLWAEVFVPRVLDRRDLGHDLVHNLLLFPLFHLWYIPVLMLALTVTYACSRWLGRAGPAVLVVVALAAAGYWLHASLTQQALPLDPRYLGYPVWFVLGVAARNRWFRCPLPVAAVLAVGGWYLYVDAFGHASHAYGERSTIGFVLLNLGVTAFVPLACRLLERLPTGRDPLRVMGQYSLWIYLLHPFVAFEFARRVDVGWHQRAGGLLLTLAVAAVAVLLVRIRWALTDRATRR